jgi:hypothetical protein
MNPPMPPPLVEFALVAVDWDTSEPSERLNPPGIWPASWLELTADCALSFSVEKKDDMSVVLE